MRFRVLSTLLECRAKLAGSAGFTAPVQEKAGNQLASSWWGGTTKFTITQIFGVLEDLIVNGVHIHQPHTGIDIGMPTGTALYTPVHAVVDGVGTDQYGNVFVKLKMDNGDIVQLLHLNDFTVHQGQDLAPGTLLGHSDSTGLSSAPHLHFEVDRNGTPIDPWGWLTTMTGTPSSGQPQAVSNPITDVANAITNATNSVSNITGALNDKRNWYKAFFFITGLGLVGLGIFVYFFKEEAHTVEVAGGTAIGAAAKAP